MSNFLWPHGLQYSRLPCPSLSPRVCSNSCLLSQWCHPTISSSVVPFSSCLQSFPASGSFPMSQLFASGGQSIAASASVLSMNIQSWSPWGSTGLISLLSKGLARVFSSSKVSICWHSAFFMFQLSHLYLITGLKVQSKGAGKALVPLQAFLASFQPSGGCWGSLIFLGLCYITLISDSVFTWPVWSLCLCTQSPSLFSYKCPLHWI